MPNLEVCVTELVQSNIDSEDREDWAEDTLDDGHILDPVIPGLLSVHHRDGQSEEDVQGTLQHLVALLQPVGLGPGLGVQGVECSQEELHVHRDGGAVLGLRDQLDLRGISRHCGVDRRTDIALPTITVLLGSEVKGQS